MVHEKKILLVEDNPDDEALTLRALSKIHIANHVDVARDGQQALDYFFNDENENRMLPQLILLDLNLPKIDGIEVLAKYRENDLTRRIPVVIMTSSQEEQDVLSGYDHGANSYIRKPVDYKQFMDAVEKLGIFWLILNTTVDSEAVGI